MTALRTTASLAARLVARLAGGVLMLAAGTFFFVQALPGDPVARLLGGNVASEDAALLRESLGLNLPIAQRFLAYLEDVLTLDFGTSFGGQPVNDIVGGAAAHTAGLALLTMGLICVLAVVFGLLFAALGRDGGHPHLSNGFTFVTGLLSAIPTYVLAMGLIALFGVWLRLLPVAGAGQPESYVLPVLALALPSSAVLARIVRVEAQNVLAADFIRTARSKSVRPIRLYARHVLPSVLTGALTIAGVMFGYLLGGVAVVESVFSWPGLGSTIVTAVNTRDYPVLQAAILLIGFGVLIVNALVDLLLAMIDPRLRSRS